MIYAIFFLFVKVSSQNLQILNNFERLSVTPAKVSQDRMSQEVQTLLCSILVDFSEVFIAENFFLLNMKWHQLPSNQDSNFKTTVG